MIEAAEKRYVGSQWKHAEPVWELFHDNDAIWRAVFEQCDAARRSIDLEQYIFGTDGVGRQLLDLLAAKARQGVKVRVLADGLGSYGLARSEGGRALVGSGGRIAMFNSLSNLVRNPFGRAHRLHRKTLICDGERLMVGGSCYQERMSNWRDTMIRVGGPLPPAVTSAFDRAWGNGRPDGTSPDPSLREGPDAGWSYALSGPGVRSRPNLREELPRRIARARRSVSLTTPYLVPDRRLWRAIVAASESGARVQIVMPARSDHRAVDVVGRRFAAALLRRGVHVRGYTGGMLHAKVALVDDVWCSVSSFNLDLFSSRLNLESGVFSTSSGLCDALAAQMAVDLARSEPL